jgi:hypothetical protein
MRYVEVRWNNSYVSATLPDELVTSWMTRVIAELYEKNGLDLSMFVQIRGHRIDL